MKIILSGLIAALLLAVAAYAGQAVTCEQGVGGRNGAWSMGTSTVSTKETPACNAGVSPCPVTAASTLILNANASRHSFLLSAVGTATLQCCLGSTCTSTAFDFILKGSTGANDGTGQSYSNSGQPSVWGGAVSCAGAAGGSLSVVAY